MKRHNIAVFFDGTGQSRSRKPMAEWSNVVLLHDATVVAQENDHVIQSRKYVNGIGTRRGEEVPGGWFGIDLDTRVEEGYDFIYEKVNNALEDGEEPHLYLFGFSRGAFAARWLASLLQFAGVRRDAVSTRKIMQSHRSNDVKSVLSWEGSGLLIRDVSIDFLGVWDTVEASIDPSFGIEDVPEIVKQGYHALAIDEWRYTFNPTRFNPSAKVSEVWFPGCHTDVGGGYVERAIANESLKWMVSGARDAGLGVDGAALAQAIASRSNQLIYHDELEGNPLWTQLNHAAGYLGKFFRRVKERDFLHPSVSLFSADAPKDRPPLPDTCVAWDGRTNNRGMGIV